MRILKHTHNVSHPGFVAVVLVVMMSGSTPFGQRHLTLPELVQRQAPEPLLQVMYVELLPDTLEEVVPKADLVLHGRVEKTETYLSADQVALYTDYTIVPMRVLVQRNPAASDIKGAPAPIVVKRWGGETTINNVKVTLQEAHFRPFERGEQLLLMLAYNTRDRKYEIAGGAAFSVSGNTIEPLIEHPRHHVFRGMNVDRFASEIAQVKAAR